jgi:ribosomal-protein-alanine N-acetyltransferase
MDSRFLIRAMKSDDICAAASLEKKLFSSASWSEQMLEQELGAPDRFYYVCVPASESGVDGAIVGYAGIWAGMPDSEVMTIGVDESFQRQGIGARLFECLIDAARSFGSRRLLLEVRVDNVPALKLYEKYGFTKMGIRKHYYQPEDVDALSLELDLRAGVRERGGNG